jgi:S-adenosylmethionine:tRNA ribosyltransferase-isomerase
LRTELLDYLLPDAQIAKHPTVARDGARMLVVHPTALSHAQVADWPELVLPGSLVVLNDTRVLPARVIGRKVPSGGRVEILLIRRLTVPGICEDWQAIGRSSKPLRPGTVVDAGPLCLTVTAVDAGGLTIRATAERGVGAALEEVGRVPIPPYLGREAEDDDAVRYQTVFARHPGSVAAPTASLHLTDTGLSRLQERGVQLAWVTLHVGLGTFRPVMVEDLDQHPMHAEVVEVPEATVAAVAQARARGSAVVAVGTTVVRALESAYVNSPMGQLLPMCGETRLLIQPGYRFGIVDSLLTNFHAPRSTLLALVAAFIGVDAMHLAYQVALESEYRFLSYGDAMWLPNRRGDGA